MAEDEDYDMLPHKEIVGIKKELEELKKKQTTTESKSVLNQINQLKDSINNLLDIFKEAQESFKLEEKEPVYIKNLLDKLDNLAHQNTRIAEGLVAVADMVKEIKGKAEKPKPVIPKPAFKPTPPPFDAPPQHMLPPQPMPPPPMQTPLPPAFDIPPPPEFPQKPRKKGLFGRLKK